MKKKTNTPIKKDLPLHQLPDIDFLASDQSPTFGEYNTQHRINFYAIVWFAENAGTHYIDFEPFPVKKNSVYLIGKNQAHSIPGLALPSARTIVFSSDFFQSIDEPYLRQLFLPFQNESIVIPISMVDAMKQLFDLLLLEYRNANDKTLLLEYTTLYLMHLHRFSQQKKSLMPTDKRIDTLMQLLEENYKNAQPAEFYAEAIGLTPKRINEILKKKMGATLSQLIQQLLVIEAKRELVHSNRSVKEIAYALGFSEQSYFTRFFKKYTKLSPEAFRTKTIKAFN